MKNHTNKLWLRGRMKGNKIVMMSEREEVDNDMMDNESEREEVDNDMMDNECEKEEVDNDMMDNECEREELWIMRRK